MGKKRYDDGGDVEESANQSEDSQAIADEAKGESMLKSMRDEASASKPKAAPKMAPKAAPASTPKAETSSGPKVGRASQATAERKEKIL